MMLNLSLVRSLSTKVPRPKNWKLSRTSIPRPLVFAQTKTDEPPPIASPRSPPKQTPHEFLKHRQTMKKLFPEGWTPPKRISRDGMESLRILHKLSPDVYTTPVLAEKFKISPEAVRRILRSKWTPSSERLEEIRDKEDTRRLERRRQRVNKEWTEVVDKGIVDHPESEPSEDKLELT